MAEKPFLPPAQAARMPCALCGKPTLECRKSPHGKVAGLAKDLALKETTAVTVTWQYSSEIYKKDSPDSAWAQGGLRNVILDLCPTCFQEELVPWFEARGGEPRLRDMAWGNDTQYSRPELNEEFEDHEIAMTMPAAGRA